MIFEHDCFRLVRKVNFHQLLTATIGTKLENNTNSKMLFGLKYKNTSFVFAIQY